MHKPETVQENEMHKFLCDFKIQTDHQIPARRPDLEIINKKKKKKKKERKKKNLLNSGFCRSSGAESENERKRNNWTLPENLERCGT